MGSWPTAGVPSNAPASSAAIAQLIACFQTGRLVEGQSLCDALLNANPDVHTLYRLAVIQSHFGRLSEALAIYDRALALKPDHADALNNRGNILQALRRFDEALASYDKAVAFAPRFAAALSNRGAALQELSRFEEALASYDGALAIDPAYTDALYNRGNILRELKQLEEALASYDRALAITPRHAEAHNNRGSVLRELRRLDEAFVSYNKALANAPNFPEALCNLGCLCTEYGKLDEAIAYLRRAVSLKPDLAEGRIQLGLALLRQNKIEDAMREAKIATQLSKQSAFPHYLHGILLAGCGARDAARVQFNACLAHDPQDRQGAHMFLARLGFEPIPERAPKALLDNLYATRAASWDHAMTGTHAYRGAELVARAVERLIPASGNLDMLDAGCGTGLVGQLMRSKARRLDGIDLSVPMLDRATKKGIYDELHQGDLQPFMAGRADRYDVVTCAATLIHFGDLRPVLQAAATALRAEGTFVFTLFANDEDDGDFAIGSPDGLAQGGCYAHGRGYVARAAEATGFAVDILDDEVHEYNEGRPRMGLVVALRRGAPSNG
jgi:predicted TPR repeat methyltransferase